jgi:hypothetical protein
MCDLCKQKASFKAIECKLQNSQSLYQLWKICCCANVRCCCYCKCAPSESCKRRWKGKVISSRAK